MSSTKPGLLAAKGKRAGSSVDTRRVRDAASKAPAEQGFQLLRRLHGTSHPQLIKRDEVPGVKFTCDAERLRHCREEAGRLREGDQRGPPTDSPGESPGLKFRPRNIHS